MKEFLFIVLILSLVRLGSAAGLDRNTNGLNDVWELVFPGTVLSPNEDTDADGFTNAQESLAGTDPRDAASRPRLGIRPLTSEEVRFHWDSVAGKRYGLLSRTNVTVGAAATNALLIATGVSAATNLSPGGERARFFRLAVDDVDSDGDAVTDYEERVLGFNPGAAHTDRFLQGDLQRVTNGWSAPSTITVSALDPLLSERWPEPGLVAVRRKGGLAPLTVNLTFGGSAMWGVDFICAQSNTVVMPLGVREVWLELHPVADALEGEATESITITLLPGPGYSVGASNVASLTLVNQTATSGPSEKAAARFLLQAAFGPDQDAADDVDYVPENVEGVMALGFEGWIEDQFGRPVGYLQPMTEWVAANGQALELYGNAKLFAWWGRVMGSPKLAPNALTNIPPDPLRQRVAFALSEILVVSDRPEQLAVQQVGMANYYDVLLRHAFGNFGDLLFDVATHPCMGKYLSHLGNQKADPTNKIYPDENFAREIMQLFSIGLWALHPDGTRQLDSNGQPIATYENGDITELARVFTGLGMGGTNNDNFGLYPEDYTRPMKMWDAYHDCQAKTLLRGLPLPARTPSPGSTGTAGLADVRAAVSNLFAHPNTGPFLGRQLIQRLVTSNPSPGYVGRVAAAFANNGAGTRGDLKAVIKAILLDAEARDGERSQQPIYGKLREPILRVVNFARAFNAASPSGFYKLDTFTLDHAQEPMSSPSVFNFFLPGHSPPGALTQQGAVAPELQIINASSAISAPNYFWNAVAGGLHRWGSAQPEYAVRLNLAQEILLVVPASYVDQDVPNVAPYDPDALLRRLDLALTGGVMEGRQFQIIRETLERLPRPSWRWHHEYLRAAIYLVVTSPDFCIQR